MQFATEKRLFSFLSLFLLFSSFNFLFSLSRKEKEKYGKERKKKKGFKKIKLHIAFYLLFLFYSLLH